MIGPGEFCKAKNNGEEFTIKWGSRKYVLPTGKTVVIPAEAVCLWFGEPGALEVVTPITDPVNGHKSFLPDRQSEIRRLRFKYGAGDGDETTFAGARVPDVDITTLDDEPVITVLQDPLGKNVNPSFQSVDDRDNLLNLVQRQQKQINSLMQTLNLEEATNEEGLPTDDETPAAATKMKVKPKAVTRGIQDVDDPMPTDDEDLVTV